MRLVFPRLLLMVFVTTLCIGLVPPNHAKAWTSTQLPKCSTTGSDLNWDWKTAIQTNVNWTTPATNRNTVGQTVDGWDGSVIMFRPQGSTTTYVAFGDKDLGPSSYNNTFGTNSAGKFYWTQNRFSSIIDSASTNVYGFSAGAHSITTASGHWTSSDTDRAPNDASQGTAGLDMDCIEFAKGFTFISGYTGYHYTGTIPDVSGVCSGIDIACRVAGVFSGIANTFQAVGEAILNGLAALFIPDGDRTATQVNGLQTYLANKLGFILYPFTFLYDLISGMNSPTGTCTSSSCVLSGTFTYGTLNIDLFAMKTTTMWTYMTLAIRAFTILGLVYMLFGRFKEVTQR